MKFYHNRGVFVLGRTHTTSKVWNAILSPRSPVSTSEVPSLIGCYGVQSSMKKFGGGGIFRITRYVDFLP